MKTNFMGIMGAVILATLILASPIIVSAQQGPFFSDVIINRVAQSDTLTEVRASHVNATNFQNTRFVITNANKNAQLAILLTAVSTGKPVRIGYTVGNPQPNTIVLTSIEIINN